MDYDIVVYTDGACKGNPGIGGWGVYFVNSDGTTKDMCGGEHHTTNNRMELTAAIMALENCPPNPKRILVITDSEYIKNGITQWIKKWKTNGWRSSSGSEVKNRDLWIRLDDLMCTRNTMWAWVRGHNGHLENERADLLANKGIDDLRENCRTKS